MKEGDLLKLEDLCQWKTAGQKERQTHEGVPFKKCIGCSGYEPRRDCYMDRGVIEYQNKNKA